MNKANLLKLATYLRSLPPGYTEFYMGTFHSGVGLLHTEGMCEMAVYHPCGTSACAVGHGPSAGLPALPTDNNWARYSVRVFDIQTYAPEWEWCFGGNWDHYAGTPADAAERIEFLVETGRIGEFPWYRS